MKKIHDVYDIVLARNGINGVFACYFAGLLHKPTIAYCGSDPYALQMAKRSLIRKAFAPIWRKFEQEKMKRANYAHYCTNYLFNQYPTRHPYLICSNVNINMDVADWEDRNGRIWRKHTVYVIGMIGKAIENKGIKTVIRALAKLGKEYRFELVGDELPESLLPEIQKEHVDGQMTFFGYWNDKDRIKGWLKSLDVYVQPSLSEGLPRATIEAMAVGCPCVATNIAGLPDILDKEYLIPPRDSDALAEKIKWLAENRAEAKKAAEKNFQKAKEFEQTVRDKKMDEFYYQIIQLEKARKENV